MDTTPEPAAPWQRVALIVDEVDVEVASDVLWSAGAAGVEELQQDGRTVLAGGFDDAAAAAAAERAAADRGWEVERSVIADDGLDGWRAWAVPERAGRWWITPTWVAPPDLEVGEEVLWIDPGPTFGSGSHPTTRLVLALLAELVRPGDAVLDVGCGSGVLAVGAARAGAGSVTATDIEPAAAEVTAANAERNGVSAAVRPTRAPLSEIVAAGARYDVVAANLLAPVIADLGPDLVRAVAPGGCLVASGLLADRWERSAEVLGPLRVAQVVEEDGWVAVVLR